MMFSSRYGSALLLALGKDALVANQTLPNACGHVNWHHFHCTNDEAHYYLPGRRM